MTKVAILPIRTEEGNISYHAMAGNKLSQGKTPGEALDALTEQLSEEETGTLVIVQNLLPDRFFTAKQQRRLMVLMDRWRKTRDKGESLPTEEQTELENLVKVELRASAARTAAIADELNQ